MARSWTSKKWRREQPLCLYDVYPRAAELHWSVFCQGGARMLGRGHGGQIPDGVERSKCKAGNTVGHHPEAQGRGSSKTDGFRRMVVVKSFHFLFSLSLHVHMLMYHVALVESLEDDME